MKKIIPGIVCGAVFSLSIFLSQIVFPAAAEDSMWLVIAVYFLVFISLFASGFWHKISGGQGGGIRVGSITGIIMLLMIFCTYVVIDRVFFTTVSRQPEKIWGLAHSGYRSMNQYLDMAHFKILLFGLPLFAFFGAVFGGIGGVLAAFLTKKHHHKIPRLLNLFRLFLPYAVLITLLAVIAHITGLIGFGYILVIGWVITLVTVFFSLVVVELLHKAEHRN